MQRIQSIDPKTAAGKNRQLFDQVESAFGMIPNAAQVMANSPAVLESYIEFSTAMGGARIGEALLHKVKLATSESNECEYCTSLLSGGVPPADLTPEEIAANRQKAAEDAKNKVALSFALEVLNNAGKVADEELDAVRRAGFDEGEIVEIVAGVVLGCFTNFLNNVADTKLEQPQAADLTNAS